MASPSSKESPKPIVKAESSLKNLSQRRNPTAQELDKWASGLLSGNTDVYQGRYISAIVNKFFEGVDVWWR